MKKHSNNTHHANVILNLFQNLNKEIREKEQRNEFFTEDIKRHPEGDNPKDLQTLGSRFFALHARIKQIRLTPSSSARVAQNDAKKENVKNLVPECPSALMPLKKKVAFTLAEVLITLGIIGIVAAMTIPTLIQKNQKRVIETKIKEDYSIIQQVIKSNEANDTDMSMIVKDQDIESQKEWFNTYFAPYMKYSQVCYDEKGCWQSKKENLTLTGKRPAYDKGIIGLGIGYDIITIRLANGTNLCIDGFAKSAYGFFGLNQGDLEFLVIYIDANGDSGPNVIGKDIFILTYTPEYGILPAGAHRSTSVVNQNCSKDAEEINAGYFCLLKMKDNGWEIPDDVWNKKV